MKLVQGLFDVSRNGYMWEAILVVTFQFDDTVEFTYPVISHLMFYLSDIYEVVGILLTLIFYKGVVHHQSEGDSIIILPP